MKINNKLSVLSVFLVLSLISAGIWATEYPFHPADWKLSEKGIEIIEKDNQKVVKVNRGKLTWTAQPFQNGTIEFEMYSEGERAFVYAYFREQSQRASEVIYLRTHKSNAPDTVQYSPVFQGRSAWQLYHGGKGTGPAALPAEQWVKVKLVVSGDSLSMWVGDEDKPVFDKLPLTGPKEAGSVSLRGFVPGASSATYSNYFRNINISPSDEPVAVNRETSVHEPGQITQLRVSQSFPADKSVITEIPEEVSGGTWQTVTAEPDGLFELLRTVVVADGVRSWAAVAEVNLHSTDVRHCRINLGFSDALTLMLNGEPLVHADASYRYSDNRQEGLLHNEQLSVFLALKAGKNKLRAVIADSFGGWGFDARLVDCPDVTVSPE